MSPVLWQVSSIRNLYLLDRRADWYRVRVPRPGRSPLRAWVLLEDYREPTPEILRQPDPVLPLRASRAQPERIEIARQGMIDGGRRLECGVYPLYTDIEDDTFAEPCARLTENLERLYRQRYGVEPVSPPVETILLFRQAIAYRRFRQREEVPYESNLAHASPAAGYVALFEGDQSRVAVLETLTHELTHLLNRRALGPALPPWLSEGVADDLAESRIGEDGSLESGRLGGEQRVEGSSITRRGAIAAVMDLQDALADGDLPALATLIELDRRQFHHPEQVQLNYAVSSFWVRYLLSGFDPELRSGFQGFLRRVAQGEPITPDLLLESLGRDWPRLEAGFRNWLRLQFLTPLNEIRSELP